MREWTGLELTPPQRDRRGTTRWNRASIRSILLNPRIAGLSVYHGEIVGQGTWEPRITVRATSPRTASSRSSSGRATI
jgi:hypothetical protein